MKLAVNSTMLLLIALVAVGIVISACASTDATPPSQDVGLPAQDTAQLPSGQVGNQTLGGTQTSSPQAGRGFTGRGFGNITPEQRQQMMAQELQQSAAACDSKAVGDTCTVTSIRGSRSGTCQTQNETLRCMGAARGPRPAQ